MVDPFPPAVEPTEFLVVSGPPGGGDPVLGETSRPPALTGIYPTKNGLNLHPPLTK
jgi:hypothetical protein